MFFADLILPVSWSIANVLILKTWKYIIFLSILFSACKHYGLVRNVGGLIPFWNQRLVNPQDIMYKFIFYKSLYSPMWILSQSQYFLLLIL